MSILGKIGSGLKKVGKVALKVAPYAAMAIPGVGVPLGMAISGAANAASKKLSGGSWKDALISGGIGAGTAAVGGGALSKIGPSSKLLSKLGAGAAGKTAGTGAAGKVGGILGGMASNALGRGGEQLFGPEGEAIGDKSWKNLANMGIDAAKQRIQGMGKGGVGQGNENTGGRGRPSDSISTGNASPRDYTRPGNAPGFNYNSNNPNLADSILAGQRSAIKNQPFRSGYDILGNLPDATDENPNPQRPILSRMPQIFSPNDPSRRRRQQPAY